MGPPQLPLTEQQNLQNRLDGLKKEEISVAAQLSYLIRDQKKQKKTVFNIKELLEQIDTAYKTLTEASIISLNEYKQIRMLLHNNTKNLKKLDAKINDLDVTIKNVQIRLCAIKDEQKKLQAQLKEWNQLIKFKKTR